MTPARQKAAEAAAALLGQQVASVTALAGGDLSDVLTVTLDTGQEVVTKGGPDPEAEADMLRALAAAGVPAPEVLAVDDARLVLSRARSGGAMTVAAWQDLGTVLRRLHNTHGEAYGWRRDYAFGGVPIRNAPAEDWRAFYSERRLGVFLPHLPADLAGRVAALQARLDTLLDADPPASLLHGDLWGGNILSDGARITALIDPASYYGHAEIDLAMLCLFGSPPAAFWDAYGGPAQGWPTRRAVYQLWPALVHLRLFGAGYRGLVERSLDAAGV